MTTSNSVIAYHLRNARADLLRYRATFDAAVHELDTVIARYVEGDEPAPVPFGASLVASPLVRPEAASSGGQHASSSRPEVATVGANGQGPYVSGQDSYSTVGSAIS